jgi:ribonuclease T2
MGRLWRLAHIAAVAFSFTFIFAVVVLAQDRRQAAPGEFDFYVLALTWSPSYCEATRERAPGRASGQQCAGRPFAFVVHGCVGRRAGLPVLLLRARAY